MVKINPKSKIWFLTRIGKDIEWRIEKRKRICLQNLILSRSEREFFSKSRISRGKWEFFLQNLDIREHLEKWKFNSPARDRKKWIISSRDFLEIENLVNAWKRWNVCRRVQNDAQCVCMCMGWGVGGGRTYEGSLVTTLAGCSTKKWQGVKCWAMLPLFICPCAGHTCEENMSHKK